MEIKLTDTQYYNDIADAIRSKNGSSDVYYPSEMADAIRNIPTGGASIPVGLKLACNSITNVNSLLPYVEDNSSLYTDMSKMFYICGTPGFTSLDLRGFNTSNVTNMNAMFYECSRLTSLDLSSFDTSNVTNMGHMFFMCRSLTSLDLSSFDTSNVTSMTHMFFDCGSLTSLDIRNFDFSNVIHSSNIFGTDTTPSTAVPSNCEIIVKDQTAKDWLLAIRPDFTNIVIA